MRVCIIILAVVACQLVGAAWNPQVENLSDGRDTVQSSVAFGGLSSRAVDQNLNSQWGGGSCTHTNNDANAWWAVDLGYTRRVHYVDIVTRKDCCSDRLANFNIGVTGDNPDSVTPDVNGPNYQMCAHSPGVQSATQQRYNCDSQLDGRFVVVQLRGTNYLTLCEVIVSGEKQSNTIGENVLSDGGKSTMQSSIGYGGDSSRAVDGNANPQWNGASCSHTALNSQPWWAVDLGATMTVFSVEIVNRQDCCSTRLSNFNVGATDNKPSAVPPTIAPVNYNLCMYHAGPQSAITVKYACELPVAGQYVIVQLLGVDYLTLCEVTVYGESSVSASSITDNLSEGKSTMMSSTAFGGESYRAVDGNVNSYWAGASCTHTNYEQGAWWAVDMIGDMTVHSVIIVNRKDCCSERLSNFNIAVTSTSPKVTAPSNNNYQTCFHHSGVQNADTVTYECTAPLVGRYVVVQLLGTNYLTLCEVTVLGEQDAARTNIALNRPAFQSSVAFGGTPGRGVDGNIYPFWAGASCTHTNNDLHAWWAVDLGAEMQVDAVTLVNRKDCCSDRLSNINIGAAHDSPTDVAPNLSPLNYDVCAHRSGQQASMYTTYVCDNSVFGRYVVVQLTGQNYLTLCEVQVWGPAEGIVNLSVGKPTGQSTTAYSGDSGRAVDGNSNSLWAGASCTHTNIAPNSWWYVDLGAVAEIVSVTIVNRRDCCSDRLSNFNVGVSFTSPTTVTPSISGPNYALCFYSSGQQVETSLNYRCPDAMLGRYVIVQLLGSNYLTLCEVSVMGRIGGGGGGLSR